MQDKIDHYVDNRTENLENQALYNRAMDEFMAKSWGQHMKQYLY